MRLAPSSSDPSRAAHAGAPQPIRATIVGLLPQDRAVIETPIGRLVAALPSAITAAPGDELALEWFPESVTPPAGVTRRGEQPGHARSWELARDAAASLAQSNDQALRAAADRSVPRAGPRLAEQLMMFVGRGDGDLARWLDEKTWRRLEQVTGGALARAEVEAGREREKRESAEWRHVTVPLLDGDRIRPIDIHARRRRMIDRGRARDQSRFVIECQHDLFGPLQIDGLLTAGEGRKRLDVILRTHAELPASDQTAIDLLFADACGAIGMQGAIAFQAVARFPDVTRDTATPHRSVVA